MRVAIHQPNFCPWLGFFEKVRQADQLVLLDDVQFIKRGFIQRNAIKTPQGRQWLGVPVITKGRYLQQIREVEINHENRWQEKAVQTLQHAYAGAPAFSTHFEALQQILQAEFDLLINLNCRLLDLFFEILAIDVPVIRASELPGVEGTGTERLIRICQAVGAKGYVSGSGGRNYQDEEAFEQAGVGLTYAEFEHPVYPQRFGPFVPNLSVLDYLFNVPLDGRRTAANQTAA